MQSKEITEEDINSLASTDLAKLAYSTVDTKLVDPAEKKNKYIRLKFGLMQALLRNFHHKLDAFMDDTRKSIISWFDWQKSMIDWQKEVNMKCAELEDENKVLKNQMELLCQRLGFAATALEED